MDIFAVIGLFFGITFILVGQAMEGGSIEQLLQITAAFIVFGGTGGAVILSFPASDLKNAFGLLKVVFFPPKTNLEPLIKEICEFSQKARKEGVIILEKESEKASDPILKLGLGAVADGTDPVLVKTMMENQIARIEEDVERGAKVWESAGGYSPDRKSTRLNSSHQIISY